MILRLDVIIALAIATKVAAFAAYKTVQQTNIDENIDQLVADGAVLLDVRTAYEFKNGHLDGAVNMPLGKIRTDYKQLDAEQAYVTYCTLGLRSIKAANLLKARGFKRVFNGGPTSNIKKYLAAE